MSDYQELEVKFYIRQPEKLTARLQALGARQIHARTFEQNLRFDTPDHTLQNAFQVLRLRQDSIARLTYKGASSDRQGVRRREEIEFEVSDFQAARRFLEALGYQVSTRYEKYRTTYELQGLLVMVDELPYGHFVELEGKNPQTIREISERLALRWEARLPESYLALFERAKRTLGWSFQHLVFSNFQGLPDPLAPLGLPPADE